MNPEKNNHRPKQKEATRKRQCFSHYIHEPRPFKSASVDDHPHG
jgi:hypothetical protein